MAGYTVVMDSIDIASMQVNNDLNDDEVPNNGYYTIALTDLQDPNFKAFLQKGQQYEITAQLTIVNTLNTQQQVANPDAGLEHVIELTLSGVVG